MSLPKTQLLRWSPLLAVLAISIGACGEDTKPASDTTDTSDTSVDDTSPDTVNDTTIEVTSGLELPAGARGCEVLLSEGGGRVAEVRFAAGVRGTFVREAPRVAIAVIRESDADFASGAVEVLGTGNPVASVVQARCVDATGAVIPNAVVTLR